MKTLPVFILFLLLAQASQAELGGAPVSTDANTQINKFYNYSTYRHQLPNDTAFVEYVDSNNNVFAVSWDGTSRPDMSVLLGNYFFQFQSLLTKATSLNGAIQLDSSSLVIQSGGRMRSFYGLAYLPQRLPADFAASTIGK